jgi:hypothetical protein
MAASEFDWMKSGGKPRSGARTQETRIDELEHRAQLMARLNMPKSRAEERLRQNLAWEYESLGEATVGKKIAEVVSQAYNAAGKRTPAPAKKKTAKK